MEKSLEGFNHKHDLVEGKKKDISELKDRPFKMTESEEKNNE